MIVLADSLLQNLVFVIVALLAWAVKAATERKEGKRPASATPKAASATPKAASATTKSTTRRSTTPARSGEVDVVYGQKRLPSAVEPRPRRGTRGSQPMEPRVGSEKLPATGGPPNMGIVPLAPRQIGSLRRQVGRVARASSHRRTGAAGRQRLGIRADQRLEEVVRAGILWSEVLALPRGLSGPHRSPVVRRMRGEA